jgi:hypothetical protein
MLRRVVLLLALVAAAAADISLFRSQALVVRAKAENSAEARIAVLEKDRTLFPLNDELYRLLGRAHFEAGSERMGETTLRDAHFQAAQANLLRSLRLNPLSPAAHFELAQGLEFFRLVGISAERRPVQEYFAAARLGLQDPEILDASGRLLLSQWGTLDEGEKRLTRGLLRTILTGRGDEVLASVLDTWALHIRDYEVIKSVLPADPAAYRRFALYLAEHSLDRDERIEALVRAENLDFERARAAAAAGRSELQANKLREAEAHFRRSRDLLQGLRFYQTLSGLPGFDTGEFKTLRSGVILGLVQTRLETARSLEEILPDALAFLEVEEGSGTIGDLERWLKERRFIADRIDASGKDLRRLAFEMKLSFQQNRYREVTEAGQALENGVLMVPETARQDYADVLELVGDAYGKLDFLYESNAFYQKARTAAGGGPALLYKLRRNYERLNDAEGLRAVDRDIRTAAAARTLDWTGITAPRGTIFSQPLFLDGKETRLALRLRPEKTDSLRLHAAVFFNGRVVWDDLLPGTDGLELDLTPRLGPNKLEILPLNRPAELAGLEVRPMAEPDTEDGVRKKRDPGPGLDT